MGLRILVVEDEPDVMHIITHAMQAAGHTVVQAWGGEDAIRKAKALKPDLVLTDLAMPGMTGWQVARAVKDRAPEVSVVMMSGFGVEVAPEDLHTHGVDLVMPKPLQIQDVLRALASIRAGTGRP